MVRNIPKTREALLEDLKSKIKAKLSDAIPLVLFYSLITNESVDIDHELFQPVFEEMKTVKTYSKYMKFSRDPKNFDLFRIKFNWSVEESTLTQEEKEVLTGFGDYLEDYDE
jgi:hypothetical protein